jgi:hypothetical protein
LRTTRFRDGRLAELVGGAEVWPAFVLEAGVDAAVSREQINGTDRVSCAGAKFVERRQNRSVAAENGRATAINRSSVPKLRKREHTPAGAIPP